MKLTKGLPDFLLLLGCLASMPAWPNDALEESWARGNFYFDGQSLHRVATGNSTFSGEFLRSYVAAVADSDSVSVQPGSHYCLPSTATSSQLSDVAKQYLEQNPGKRHLNAAYLVRSSFRQAFPCPTEAKKPR